MRDAAEKWDERNRLSWLTLLSKCVQTSHRGIDIRPLFYSMESSLFWTLTPDTAQAPCVDQMFPKTLRRAEFVLILRRPTSLPQKTPRKSYDHESSYQDCGQSSKQEKRIWDSKGSSTVSRWTPAPARPLRGAGIPFTSVALFKSHPNLETPNNLQTTEKLKPNDLKQFRERCMHKTVTECNSYIIYASLDI